MPIHVQVWSGACNARVTDMTNAGKRGKTCRVLRFSGSPTLGYHPNETLIAAHEFTVDLLGRLSGLDTTETTFEQVAELLANAVASARQDGITDAWLSFCEDQPIRAIDAPKPELHAGNEKWSGRLDNDGVHLRDLTDKFNEPCECTHGQTGTKAYKLATKVWGKVKEAETMHEASEILRAAGCRLHYWCAID